MLQLRDILGMPPPFSLGCSFTCYPDEKGPTVYTVGPSAGNGAHPYACRPASPSQRAGGLYHCCAPTVKGKKRDSGLNLVRSSLSALRLRCDAGYWLLCSHYVLRLTFYVSASAVSQKRVRTGQDDIPERHSRRRSWPSPPQYNPPGSPQ